MQHKMGMCEGMHITPTHNIKDDEAIQKKNLNACGLIQAFQVTTIDVNMKIFLFEEGNELDMEP